MEQEHSGTELETIIEQEFLNSASDINNQLIETAVHQLAIIHGLSIEEQRRITANSILKKLLIDKI